MSFSYILLMTKHTLYGSTILYIWGWKEAKLMVSVRSLDVIYICKMSWYGNGLESWRHSGFCLCAGTSDVYKKNILHTF